MAHLADRPGPEPIPHGRTARRLEWAHLPPPIRRLVERRCGSPVVEAQSQGSGFTPGFASVLLCEDGSRHFVKAASVRAQRAFATAYAEESRKLAALPVAAPAPRLLWSLVDDDWVVLGIEQVEARAPRRPWRADELDRCLDLTTELARALTPAPAAMGLGPIAADLADWPALWRHAREHRTDLDPARLEEAAGLAGGALAVCGGDTLVHTDVRDDNVLLCADGRTLLCDWNWPALGAAWLDTVFLLIGPRGDGLDVDAVLATHPLTRDVPRDHVDAVLALACGYFTKVADDPVPPTSPHIRDHQRWCAAVTWAWLAERRGW